MGLCDLVPADGLAQWQGKPRHGGAFAVPKNESESRWISPAEFVNDVTDDSRLPRVVLPYLPQLATLTFPKGRRARVTKRGARHSFRTLRISQRWRHYMGLPPIKRHDEAMYPRFCSWPMGYKLSAAVAQSIIDRVARDARLPLGHRLRPGVPCPRGLPVWGTIIDDVWVIIDDSHDAVNEAACSWGDKVDRRWGRIGVKTHPGKAINTKEYEEVPGAMVDSDAPAMSLSAEKEAFLLRGTLRLATAFRPARVSVERTLGKHGHAHSFRPALRSICGEVYPWVRDAWENGQARVDMNYDCMIEIVLLALMLPFARMDFMLPWCPRVEASGASPGGHGRAYMHADIDTVQSWATLAAHRGDYITLLERDELPAPPAESSCMQLVDFPTDRYFWHTVPRPGGTSHISVEEYRAFNWSVESHIHRVGEMNMRCVHMGHNTTQVGAHAKGRSSSRQLNHYCRQDCSIQIAGNIIPFVLWVPSARNPTDEPSSKYGIRAARRAQEAARRWPLTAKPAPAASHVGDDDATPLRIARVQKGVGTGCCCRPGKGAGSSCLRLPAYLLWPATTRGLALLDPGACVRSGLLSSGAQRGLR